MNGWKITPHWLLLALLLSLLMPGGLNIRPAGAESALELLSGFDVQRITDCYPVDDSDAAGEMARLLYRLRKADPNVIAARSAPAAAVSSAGDVARVEGTISAIRQYKVPAKLVEFLELESFQEIVLEQADLGETLSVFAPTLVGKISHGDFIKADAVWLSSDAGKGVFAAGRVAWIPATAESVGWRLLAEQGVDLSYIAELASRNRKPLEADDGEAFYSMIAAAKTLQQPMPIEDQPRPVAETVQPVELLQHPQQYHGQWIRLNANTVRITRVSVTELRRREQLGQDHYYQIDASGDLGRYVIRLERSDQDAGEPIEMSGTYPVTLVSAEIPEFLQQQLEANNAVVSMTSHPVSIDGFFYRLWSYQNEFMTREGGGKQVGPLIVVSDWRSLAVNDSGGQEVQVIGYVLALGILAAIIATVWWTRRNAWEDARVRDQSREVKIDL